MDAEVHHPATEAACVHPASDAPFVVRAEGFTYRYPPAAPDGQPRAALEDLTFAIPRGQIVSLTGPSGSGLTTLCLAIAGIVPHETGGSVRGALLVAGADATRVPPAALARSVGILFEDPEANLIGLSAAEEVAFALELRGLPPTEVARRVDWALATVGLAHERDRPAGQLSGGQKQRLALAVALALRPELLVLDRPTAQLDPGGKRDLLRTLVALTASSRSLTVVLAERDGDLLLQLADRLLGLDAGRLVFDAPIEQAFRDPDRLHALGLWEPQLVALARLLRGTRAPSTPSIFRGTEEAAAFLRRSLLRKDPDSTSPPHVGGRTETARDRQDSPPRAPTDRPAAVPVLRVDGVSYRYPDGPLALQHVEFSVFPGEVVAIVGPNGSGKTTLARLVIGALRPSVGRILVAEQDTRTVPRSRLAASVGYVAQNPDQQLVRATPLGEVAFGLRQLGLPVEQAEQRARSVLARFGLERLADEYTVLLSRGQRQLVAIAAAAAREPALLVLDEPTSALDRSGEEMLVHLLDERTAAGHSTLLISHDLRLVARCAHRVLLLADGAIRAAGEPNTVLGNAPALEAVGLVPLPVSELAHRLGLPPLLEPEELVAALDAPGSTAARSSDEAPPHAPPTIAPSPAGSSPKRSERAPSFLARLDVRVKLTLAIGASLPFLLWESPLLLAGTTVALHLLLWYGGGFDRHRLAAVWRALTPLLVLVLVLRPLFDRVGDPILFAVGPLALTLPGLLAALAAALRLVTLALVALAWFATTSERALVQGLVRFGLPSSVGLALVIGLRFIPLFLQTFATATEALQTRGWSIPERGMARLRALLPVLSVALAATLRQAQQLSWVLAVRGVGTGGHRPQFGERRLRPVEWVLLLGGLALELSLLAATLAGLGRSPLWPLS
ncbi:MAG: ATP-binding cassette domain-containing protein [Thermomicrobium sp.]|nr:ATP-binding cassette domain-containing protein [Thermomicrobium sp.]